jgi:hypothetical protein
MLCSTGFLHFSSGVAPQKLQDSPFLFKRGLLLAQVPENSPSFFKIILIAIPAKHNAKIPIMPEFQYCYCVTVGVNTVSMSYVT